MSLKIGINGFGRIGRLVMRIGAADTDLEFVGVNDLVPAKNLAYLLKYDSTHGRFDGTVEEILKLLRFLRAKLRFPLSFLKFRQQSIALFDPTKLQEMKKELRYA